MLPAEILDQVTSLNTQHRELVSVINQLSRSSEITSQLILDDLTSRIKIGFAEADQGIENLETLIETEDDFSVKNEGDIYLAKINEDFKLARASFRKLLLQASKTLTQTRHTQAAQALFQSTTPPTSSSTSSTSPPTPITAPQISTLRQRKPPTGSNNDTSLLNAANDVTLALKRTHALLEQELEKSTLSLETLDHSSQTLRQLDQSYGTFDVLLRGSKRLIVELERADKWDRWSIYGGLAVFGLVCLWIVYKRILRGPIGLIIWGFGKAFGQGAAVTSVSRRLVESTVSSVTGTTMGRVDVTRETMETGFEIPREEELWSEGFEDDVVTEIDTVTVTVEVDEQTPLPEAAV